MEIGLWR